MKNKKVFIILSLIVCIIISIIFINSKKTVIVVENPVEEIIECEIKEHNYVYLAINEKYVLDDTGYVSNDESIAKVSGNKVIGIGVGKTTLTLDCNKYEIEVTDMITAPYVSDEKEHLPCGRYSEKENDYLDGILASKINNVGYKTRAGAVEAARFLLLQFPYHMEYFSENGRLPECDGEGRYYHKGLYLNKYKVEKENITQIINGPAEWGCEMLSNQAEKIQRNSLNCSGFISWCLLNAGFDPGDIGAGVTEATDFSDFGDWHEITDVSLDKVRVGDLFAEDGHIAILIGIKDGVYYIAESNFDIDMRVRVSTKDELKESAFYAWIDMDKFYEHNDGLLTIYWE